MKTIDFNFELPPDLIAQYPPLERGQSRLMLMNRQARSLEHRMVRDLPSIVERGTVMVFNDSKVRKARLFGVSGAQGAQAEFLLLHPCRGATGGESGQVWLAMAKKPRRLKAGTRFIFDDVEAEILPASLLSGDGTITLRFEKPVDDAWLDIHGHVPLPPYIKRDYKNAKALCDDADRYQTVYANEYGSAAAPTAGLHFTEELFGELEGAGIESVFITLHVGLGTFLPVRTENIEDHRMHEEIYFLDEESACRIEKAKREGRKILAVGTTSVRTLESAWIGEGKLRRGEGSTSIFIFPPYDFKVVDEVFTNFHTPQSSLLMLVSAFAGMDFILDSYKEAVKSGYRFFSYGDACLIK